MPRLFGDVFNGKIRIFRKQLQRIVQPPIRNIGRHGNTSTFTNSIGQIFIIGTQQPDQHGPTASRIGKRMLFLHDPGKTPKKLHLPREVLLRRQPQYPDRLILVALILLNLPIKRAIFATQAMRIDNIDTDNDRQQKTT